MGSRKIWVACGNAVASSTMAAHTLGKLCEERGLDVEIEVIAFHNIPGKSTKPKLIVSLAPNYDVSGLENMKGVQVVSGIALITGIGKESVMDQIQQILEDE